MPFSHFREWSDSLSITAQHFTTVGSGPAAAANSKQYMAEAAARQQKTEMLARLYDGKLRLERRNGAPKIYACAYFRARISSRQQARSRCRPTQRWRRTGTSSCANRVCKGQHLHGRSFADMAEAFIAHANQLREVSDGHG